MVRRSEGAVHPKLTVRVWVHLQVNLVRAVRVGAEKAIEVNENEDLAYHLLGRWHNEMVRAPPLGGGPANTPPAGPKP